MLALEHLKPVIESRNVTAMPGFRQYHTVRPCPNHGRKIRQCIGRLDRIDAHPDGHPCSRSLQVLGNGLACVAATIRRHCVLQIEDDGIRP